MINEIISDVKKKSFNKLTFQQTAILNHLHLAKNSETIVLHGHSVGVTHLTATLVNELINEKNIKIQVVTPNERIFDILYRECQNLSTVPKSKTNLNNLENHIKSEYSDSNKRLSWAKYNFIILEEADELSQEAFDLVDYYKAHFTNIKVLISANPINKESPLYRRCYKHPNVMSISSMKHPNVTCPKGFPFPFPDNPIRPQWIEEKLKAWTGNEKVVTFDNQNYGVQKSFVNRVLGQWK